MTKSSQSSSPFQMQEWLSLVWVVSEKLLWPVVSQTTPKSWRLILVAYFCHLKVALLLTLHTPTSLLRFMSIDNFETFWEISGNQRPAEDLLAQLAALRELAFIVTLRGIQRPGNIHWIKIDPLQTLTQGASMDLLSVITEEEYSGNDLVCIRKLLNAVSGIPLAVTLIGSLLRDESETLQSLWNHWTRESARAIRVVNEVDSDDRLYRLDISLRLSVFGPRMNENAKAMLAAISILPTGMNMDEEWLDRFQGLLPVTVSVRDCIRTLRNVALATLDSSTNPPRLKLLPPVRDFCLNSLPVDGELPRRLLVIDIYNTDLRRYWDTASSQNYTWATTELSNITAVLNLSITLRYITDDFGWSISKSTEWLRRFLTEFDTVERAINILSEHPKAKAICLRALGGALIDYHREREAIQHLDQALSILKEAGDSNKRELGNILYFIGAAHYRLSDCANAEYYLSSARDLYTETNQKWMSGVVSRTLTATYRLQGKMLEAEREGKEAVELCRISGNRIEGSRALRELGNVYRDQGKHDLAIDTLLSVVEASKLVRDVHGEAGTHESLGHLYQDTNKPDDAILHFRLAVSLFEQARDPKEADAARDCLRKVEESSNATHTG